MSPKAETPISVLPSVREGEPEMKSSRTTTKQRHDRDAAQIVEPPFESILCMKSFTPSSSSQASRTSGDFVRLIILHLPPNPCYSTSGFSDC